MTSSAVYENLYNKMKNAFTVINDNNEYTLGDYMLIKANEKTEAAVSGLPTVRANGSNKAVSAFFSYINEKLVVKTPPVKDKTMRAFPFRTSMAAVLSAAIGCALLFTFGATAVRNINELPAPASIEYYESESLEEEFNVSKN